MTKRILVAVDLSEASIAALKAAQALAAARGARLAIVHVVGSVADVRPFFPKDSSINATNMLELDRLAREVLERRVSEVDGCSDAELFVELGVPYAEIVRRAEAWNADLVVVASHGRTGITRALLGSVAEHVVRTAHCPVLVSRPIGGSGIVMAATDLSEPSLRAVARGVDEARLRHARLVVVHVMETSLATYGASVGALLGPTAPASSAEDQLQVRSVLTTMLGDAMRRFGGEGDALILEGEVVASVIEAVEAQQPDLLVVETHGRTGISRLLLGSVAEKLVRLAHCSVLVMRKTA